MELEVGLKITKTRDDGSNFLSSDLLITKDSTSPLFFSTETESLFVLSAHLKGYRRERTKIEINEDGTQITINAEKIIQEMVMMKWTTYKREIGIKRFSKVFRIPNGVVLDKIKAKFNEEETILSIFMPKLNKGIQGIGINPVKEESEQHEPPQTEETEEPEKCGIEENVIIEPTLVDPPEHQPSKEKEIHKEIDNEEQEVFEKEPETSCSEAKPLSDEQEERDLETSSLGGNPQSDNEEEQVEEPLILDTTEESLEDGAKTSPISSFRGSRFIVGSAFISLLIAFVIHLLRKNKKPRKYVLI